MFSSSDKTLGIFSTSVGVDNIEQRPTNIPVNHLLEIGLGLLRRNCPLLYFHEIHFHFHENMYHAKGIIIFVVHESPKFMIFSRECFRPIPSRRGGGGGAGCWNIWKMPLCPLIIGRLPFFCYYEYFKKLFFYKKKYAICWSKGICKDYHRLLLNLGS